MFISSIVFKKWRGAVDAPSPSPGTAIKAHSLISGNFLAALGWDKLVPGLPPSGPKHRGELTSRNWKFHMNSLHRDERPKTWRRGREEYSQPRVGSFCLGLSSWVPMVPEMNKFPYLNDHFFVPGWTHLGSHVNGPLVFYVKYSWKAGRIHVTTQQKIRLLLFDISCRIKARFVVAFTVISTRPCNFLDLLSVQIYWVSTQLRFLSVSYYFDIFSQSLDLISSRVVFGQLKWVLLHSSSSFV